MLAGMNPRPQGIPLRPDPAARRDAYIRSLARACIATAVAASERPLRAADYAKRAWGDDHIADMVLRAAVTPASLAGNSALTSVSQAFLAALVPASAGADLLARGIGLDFGSAASIRVPAIALPTADFVGEGAPAPTQIAPTSAGPTLTPHKIMVLTSLTNELLRSSDAEDLVRQVLVEATAPALDKALFSATAATSDRPAGLLNGITGLTPASSASAKEQILVDDMQALVAAVAPVAGNNNLVAIASPDAAVALRLRVFREDLPILMSSSLAARTVIVVVPSAIVSAVSGPPQIDASTQAAFVRDTTPQEIVTAAGTVATSVGSTYQTDETLLRLRWPITWALRDPRALSFMVGVNW
jgi:hypothetical protein